MEVYPSPYINFSIEITLHYFFNKKLICTFTNTKTYYLENRKIRSNIIPKNEKNLEPYYCMLCLIYEKDFYHCFSSVFTVSMNVSKAFFLADFYKIVNGLP
ncbi:MAG: hypothetical protein LBU74_00870 [Methanobacteriaceae archaeon]|jgi:hypothetical protein|nr:hypothetical protein [Candidatus Methanorudis spinitermitis]